MSKLKDIPELSFEEFYQGSTKAGPLSTFIPRDKPLEKLKGIKGAPKLSEDAVIKKCREWLSSLGWISKTIYTGGIPIPNTWKKAPNPAKGIPDNICFHISKRKSMWIEYKKSHGGEISLEQDDWHQLLRLSGHTVLVISSLEQLKEEYEKLFIS